MTTSSPLGLGLTMAHLATPPTIPPSPLNPAYGTSPQSLALAAAAHRAAGGGHISAHASSSSKSVAAAAGGQAGMSSGPTPGANGVGAPGWSGSGTGPKAHETVVVFVFDTSLARDEYRAMIGQGGAVAAALKRIVQLGSGKSTEVGSGRGRVAHSPHTTCSLRLRLCAQLRIATVLTSPSAHRPIIHQTYFSPLQAFLGALGGLGPCFPAEMEPEEVDAEWWAGIVGGDAGTGTGTGSGGGWTAGEGVQSAVGSGKERNESAGLLDGLVAGLEVGSGRD